MINNNFEGIFHGDLNIFLNQNIYLFILITLNKKKY